MTSIADVGACMRLAGGGAALAGGGRVPAGETARSVVPARVGSEGDYPHQLPTLLEVDSRPQDDAFAQDGGADPG
eukprot:1799574-Rhodomonas_salina.1